MINSIGYGGAERALASILTAADDQAHDVHLVILDNEPARREMPGIAARHVLNARGKVGRSIVQLRALLRELRPDLVVSFLVRANVASALAARSLSIPVIVCERMHLSSHFRIKHRRLKRIGARAGPRWAYRFADLVLGVSEGVSRDLIGSFGVAEAKVRTINNPYDLKAIREAASMPPEFALPDRFVVSSGRLEQGKNFASLIRAYHSAKSPPPLVMLGEGALRKELEALVAGLGLQERILLPGYARNPFAVVGRAELFISSSLNEGFPNAMVEAMVLGTPVIATDCPAGPAEILGSKAGAIDEVTFAEFGMLVPQDCDDALAEAITAMSDSEIRRHYSAKARERSEDFEASCINRQYWALFEQLMSPRS